MLQYYIKKFELSQYYVVSFDESLNKSLQRGQMDILVRYWNADPNFAETHLKSEFLGGANAEQYRNHSKMVLLIYNHKKFFRYPSMGQMST